MPKHYQKSGDVRMAVFRPSDPHHPAAAAGFTLVEMLASLSLLGLMLALLAGSVRWAEVRWRQTEAVVTAAQQESGFLQHLSRDLANAVPPLQGTPQEMILTVFEPPTADSAGGWVQVIYRLENHYLSYSRQPLRRPDAAAGPAVTAPPLVLFPASFRYAGQLHAAPDAPSPWQAFWTDPHRLPQQVQLIRTGIVPEVSWLFSLQAF